ncbi:5-hydroxytryptamine receptor 1A [Xenopus laevis]|uniref:5-hydroxytryptamine receptor 1A n=2 Tax=Xenopus laevis TaxID=8355 RepID=5HT1A_XENLA|nr:5-hydroxytryptamine receptor 1A [Xenopus laevis]Q98998.1 RecName: Full=5-hydroxytryptamine receptor 1A; Short=5-HT-1A; Short=5-HT1A; Short=x5-HT1A; AltName: Full=Serotonin receptor 1A [Xenopus laevis]CAA69208.1 5-HT1A receptor [Xenopus laevis]
MDASNNTTSWNILQRGRMGPSWRRCPVSYQIIASLFLGRSFSAGIFGNACVIAAIALERSLQNVANYLIGSLAVTDLMVSVLVLPMAAQNQVLNKWTLGQVTCDIFISLDVLCCTSSILHLCAIALDRYWAITDPIDYVNKRTPRRAAVLISITWIVGFSISIPPMLGWRTPEDRSDPNACRISEDPGYTIYSTFGAFYIPLILMLVLYGKIFKAARFRIRKTVKKAEKKKVADTCLSVSQQSPKEKQRGAQQELEEVGGAQAQRCVNGAIRHGEEGAVLEIIEVHHYVNSKCHLHCKPVPPPEQLPPALKNDRATEAKRKVALARERKTVKTLGIIMGTFILCWLPFFIVALVLPFCETCHMPHLLFDIITWLGYSNSLLNPIIYAYFNKDFQSAFKKIIKCKFCRQ